MTAGTPSWLVTFADLAALLLAFFVLTFAMTDPDRERLRQLVASFAGDGHPPPAQAPRATGARTEAVNGVADASYAVRVLGQRFATLEPACRPRVRGLEGHLLLRLPSAFLAPERCQAARREVGLAWRGFLARAGRIRLYLPAAAGGRGAQLEGLASVAQRFERWFGRRPAVFLVAPGPGSGDPLLWLEGS